MASTAKELKCWNCGKVGHNLNKCKDTQNEDCIAENCRKKGWSTPSGSGGAMYQRKKWSPPKSGESGIGHIMPTVASNIMGWIVNGTLPIQWAITRSGLHRVKHSIWPRHVLLMSSFWRLRAHWCPGFGQRCPEHRQCVHSSWHHLQCSKSTKWHSMCTLSEQLLMESTMKSLNLN